jgi:hypothetical protein
MKKRNSIAMFYLGSGVAVASVLWLIGVGRATNHILIFFLIAVYLLPAVLAEHGWIIELIWTLTEDAPRAAKAIEAKE